MAEAGYPERLRRRLLYLRRCLRQFGEAVLNNLGEVGIRAKLRPLERAAFFKGYADKKYKNIIQGATGAFGNAATRLEASW